MRVYYVCTYLSVKDEKVGQCVVVRVRGKKVHDENILYQNKREQGLRKL